MLSKTTEKPRVLIAERDGIVATDLQSLFVTWGFEEPLMATSMEKLIQNKNKEKFDLVVIDENCQNSSTWFTMIRMIIKEYNSTVVFLSDFFNAHLPESLMAEKSFFLVPKPFNQNELQSIACSATIRK